MGPLIPLDTQQRGQVFFAIGISPVLQGFFPRHRWGIFLVWLAQGWRLEVGNWRLDEEGELFLTTEATITRG
ncbi:MAG: hypothetical protein KGZ64_10525, partial [Thermaerobacter sp.]|nr:hypothetical protein [Thermaerobacter sp.]